MNVGSLFSGYGGLDMGVQAVLGGDVVWHSDIDKGSCKLLAHRFPGVPNLGDISAVDWSQVEPVDVLTGGFPCQDVSHAGKRAGLRPDTRTGLWSQMAYAIDQLRPALVVAENVRGLLSAEAHSDVEPCPWCVGDGAGQPALRALGAVLGDLADLGYDASWYGLRAADVGAPHGRFRVFVVAYPEGERWAGRDESRPDVEQDRPESAHGRSPGRALLPTPRATDGSKGGPNQRGSSGDLMLPSAVAHLLPTPAVNDMGEGKTPEAWDAWTDRMKTEHGNGNGHGASLAIEAQRLLPSPTAQTFGTQHGNDPTRQTVYSLEAMAAKGMLCDASTADSSTTTTTTPATDTRTPPPSGPSFTPPPNLWGDYAPAIARWEAISGRPAPTPTMTSAKGNPQLAPAFVEWMMGLPAGWITDVPGLTRNDMLKLCGNGVVPQQAEAALWVLLARTAVAA